MVRLECGFALLSFAQNWRLIYRRIMPVFISQPKMRLSIQPFELWPKASQHSARAILQIPVSQLRWLAASAIKDCHILSCVFVPKMFII